MQLNVGHENDHRTTPVQWVRRHPANFVLAALSTFSGVVLCDLLPGIAAGLLVVVLIGFAVSRTLDHSKAIQRLLFSLGCGFLVGAIIFLSIVMARSV